MIPHDDNSERSIVNEWLTSYYPTEVLSSLLYTHIFTPLHYSFSLLTCLLIRVVHGDSILHIIILAALMTAAWYEVCQLPQWHLYSRQT